MSLLKKANKEKYLLNLLKFVDAKRYIIRRFKLKRKIGKIMTIISYVIMIFIHETKVNSKNIVFSVFSVFCVFIVFSVLYQNLLIFIYFVFYFR